MTGKYDKLKEPDNKNTYTGNRFVRQLSSFTKAEDGIAVIQGLPACPECGKTLVHEFLKNEWYCSGCGTGWSEESLVEALQNERAIAELCKEEANDSETD